jgi:SPP1 family predicted phage head-tail adaptor
MSLAAGRLRHRVAFERLTNMLDSSGDTVQDPDTGAVSQQWLPLGEAWAAIEPLSAKEFIQSQEMQSKVEVRIVVRRQDYEINAADRVLHGLKVYNVAGVLEDKDSGLEYVTLPCSRGVTDKGQ